MTKRFTFALIGALMTAIPGAALAETSEITVVVPNPSAIANFPVFVALSEGYFDEAGLDVTVQAVNGSAAVLQSLVAGQAQIGLPGAGPVLAANERGENVVLFFNQFPRSVFSFVVPAEDETKQVSELRGTVIGIGTSDGSEAGFARSILTDAGLVEGTDYEFLVVGEGGTAAAAFLNEEIDAYVAGAVDAAIIQARGISVRDITPADGLGLFGNGWAATADYIQNQPEVIEHYGAALKRAMDFAADPENLEAVMAAIGERSPQELEDEAFASAMLSVFQQRMTPADPNQATGYMPESHWKDWHDSAIASGQLSAALPDITLVYTNQFVDAWNEEAR